jgi:hypothetical protein
MGHANGDITTHYSAAELGELLAAAEKVTDRGIAQTPALTLIRQPCAGCRKSVGSEGEIKRRVSGVKRRNPMFFLIFVWWAVLGSNQRPIG